MKLQTIHIDLSFSFSRYPTEPSDFCLMIHSSGTLSSRAAGRFVSKNTVVEGLRARKFELSRKDAEGLASLFSESGLHKREPNISGDSVSAGEGSGHFQLSFAFVSDEDYGKALLEFPAGFNGPDAAARHYLTK